MVLPHGIKVVLLRESRGNGTVTPTGLKIMKRLNTDARRITIAAAVLILLGVVLLISLYPQSDSRLLSSVVRVEARSRYLVTSADGDSAYLPLCSEAHGRALVMGTDETERTDLTATCISNAGHLLASDSLLLGMPDSLRNEEARKRLALRDSVVEHELKTVDNELGELNYYARTHSVVDDGYNDVMAHRVRVEKYRKTLDSLHVRYGKLLKSARPLMAHLEVKANAICHLPSDSSNTETYVLPVKVVRHDASLGMVLLQPQQKMLPKGFHRMSVNWLSMGKEAVRMAGMADFGGATSRTGASMLQLNDSITRHSACEGAMTLSSNGHVRGIWLKGREMKLEDVHRFLKEEHGWFMWQWTNLSSWVKQLFTFHPGLPKPVFQPTVTSECIVSHLWNSGTYRGQVKRNKQGKAVREGHGQWTDSTGCTYRGIWQADTLAQGERMDSLGFYRGQLNAALQPEGTGLYLGNDGEWYEGEWKAGKRHGHGYSVKRGTIVKCGAWKNGRFLGEHMIYTADRVYGIDISRYQHEIGKKKYGIDWSSLRISSLGSGRRVSGAVDYPVSFVYIKATQGTRISNKYYPADIRQARRHGIPVGSYHFYSSKSGGAEQAAWFLRMAWVAESDLPPVLDLEPTEAQIKEMGGEQRMFQEVLKWMRIVEQRRGKRPVLYVGQLFVNNHLVNAPEALRKYDVWIARYGEFKPYVHLLHWQLTPYGRVRGIHGEVDINVFNGTKAQFREYLHNGSF